MSCMRKPSRSDNAVIQYFNIEMRIEPNIKLEPHCKTIPNRTEPEPNRTIRLNEPNRNGTLHSVFDFRSHYDTIDF